MQSTVSRRDLFRNVATTGATLLGVAALAACDGGAKEAAPAAPKPAPMPEAPKPAAPPPPADAAGELACTDVSALAEPDKAMRTTLNYQDRAADPAKTCKACQLYVEATEPGKCGGCQVLKGPIHPMGSCNSWVAKAG